MRMREQRQRQRVTELIAGLAIASAALACGPPKAAPIEGDLSHVIERAMAQGTGGFDHTAWDAILKAHGRDEGRRFDYVGLKREEQQLDDYLTSLAEVDLSRLTSRELEALFINAYNAYTVRTILDHVSEDGEYAIGSIRDIENVFGRERHVVGGFTLSLDNIEHNVLRPTFKDPRLHFAVNCASRSCPPLPLRAFKGESLDEQLEAATKAALTNPDYVSVEENTLVLTKILEWYGGDFTNPSYRGSEASLPAFIRKYADAPVREWIDSRTGDVPIRFRDYDWNLNRAT